MDIDFTIKGVDETLAKFQALGVGLDQTARTFVEDVTEHIAVRSHELAPQWEYRLRPAIEAVPVFKVADGYDGGVIVPEHIHWAGIMHEELQPYGSGPYTLGEISKTRPGGVGKEGGVGGKFITRVVEAHKLQYRRHLSVAIRFLVQGGKQQRWFRFSP
jgi:hypothetical protein